MAASRPRGYADPDRLVVDHDLVLVDRDPVLVDHDPVVVDPAPVAPAVEHQPEVNESGAFARAVCAACGWSGPARRSRAVAATDAEQHPGSPAGTTPLRPNPRSD